jgi:CheY-like chemotaxis protein
MMNGITGFDLLKLIREDNELCVLPVIVLTSLLEQDERIKGLQLGADDFISKPFDMHELRAKLNTQVKLFYLRSRLNERSRLIKIINLIDEGVIVANPDFVPVIINTKAKKLLLLKETPENILGFINAMYGEEIKADIGRRSYILTPKENTGNDLLSLSLTVDSIKDTSDIIDSYIFIINEWKNKAVK